MPGTVRPNQKVCLVNLMNPKFLNVTGMCIIHLFSSTTRLRKKSKFIEVKQLTLSDLNLFKKLKKINLKTKQIDIYRSCQYRKQLNSIGKDPNNDLITPNGITGSERVKITLITYFSTVVPSSTMEK